MTYFAENIKRLRKINKISLEELGIVLNISKSAISDYENEKSSPTLLVCSKIANYFGITIDKMNNSIITEFSLQNKDDSNDIILLRKQLSEKESYSNQLEEENKRMSLEVRIQKQKIDSLQLQIKLHDQLKDSKISEIELLKTQIRLLEEKINLRN